MDRVTSVKLTDSGGIQDRENKYSNIRHAMHIMVENLEIPL